MKIEKYVSLNPLYFNEANKLNYDYYSILSNGNIKVKCDCKYGVVSYEKEIIIPVDYEDIDLNDDIYICKKDNCRYDIYHNDFLVFKDILYCQLLDNFTIISKYENVYEVYDKLFYLISMFVCKNEDFYIFEDGLFFHQTGNKFGVRNIFGNVILEDKYDKINFVDDLIETVRKNKVDYFDFSGKKILDRSYNRKNIVYLESGVFLIQDFNKQKLVNKNGNVLRLFKNSFSIYKFYNGYAEYKENFTAGYNYIDIKGNDIFDEDFISQHHILSNFIDCFIYSKKDFLDIHYHKGLIDANKKEILPPRYYEIKKHGNYIIARIYAMDGDYFLFDCNGKDVIGKSCNSIFCLNEDLPLFILDIKDNYYIYDGIELHKIQGNKESFDNCTCSKNSLKYIKFDSVSMSGLIDTNGKIVIPAYFKNIDYNDDFMILDGYLLPFHFNKNSNLKLSLDDILYYNIDITLNDKVITKTFASLEKQEQFVDELLRLDEERNNLKKQIDVNQDNKIYELLNSNFNNIKSENSSENLDVGSTEYVKLKKRKM